MPMHLYEVTATIHDAAVEQAWVDWILNQHIADVVAAGGERGRLVHVDTDDGTRVYAVQYEFASRAALDVYLSDHAPRLRDEGRALFNETQISYTRRTGAIHLPRG